MKQRNTFTTSKGTRTGYRKLQNTNKQHLPMLAHFPFVCM